MIYGTNYDISVSSWAWFRERQELLDFLPTFVVSPMRLVLVPQRPAVDLGLVIRPFTSDAWKVQISSLLSCCSFSLQ